jgi:hypothetical protein
MKLDPVTRGMSIVLSFVQIDIDVQYWSQIISFIMIGVMVALTVRGFLLRILQVSIVFAMPVYSRGRMVLTASVAGCLRLQLLIHFDALCTCIDTNHGNVFRFHHFTYSNEPSSRVQVRCFRVRARALIGD